MTSTLKQWLLFISFVIFAALVFYGITVFDKHESRAQDLEEMQVKRDVENDSLRQANTILQNDRARLIESIANDESAIKQNKQYYTNKTRQDISKPANEQNRILIDMIEK